MGIYYCKFVCDITDCNKLFKKVEEVQQAMQVIQETVCGKEKVNIA
jgi:hypothetical protein